MTTKPTFQVLKADHGDIQYYDEGSGPVLLLIHGSGPGVTGWANFGANLVHYGQYFRCLIIDLPGYGDSTPIAGEPISSAVNAVKLLLDKLGIDKTHILGNSLGGIVGSHFAAMYPERIARFITIGGVGLNVFSTFPGEGLNLLSAFAEDPTRERLKAWLLSMVYDPTIITEELLAQRFAQATHPTTLATTRKIYSREAIAKIANFRESPDSLNTVKHLAAIQAPTLITWGREDRVSPLDSALLPMRLIPNAELHVFPKCGHWAMIECKAAFESLTTAFLLQK